MNTPHTRISHNHKHALVDRNKVVRLRALRPDFPYTDAAIAVRSLSVSGEMTSPAGCAGVAWVLDSAEPGRLRGAWLVMALPGGGGGGGAACLAEYGVVVTGRGSVRARALAAPAPAPVLRSVPAGGRCFASLAARSTHIYRIRRRT